MKMIRRPSFWLILLLLVLITMPHYQEVLRYPPFLLPIMSYLGITRHAFERILYLAPIVWAGFLFGWRGAIFASLAAVGVMLPRIIFISPNPVDAILETSAIFIIGNALAISSHALRKEREYRTKLEGAQETLRLYLGQVNKAQEEERKRISHELHDDTIQALVVLTRQLDTLISSSQGFSEEDRLRLEELWQKANNIMQGVRRLSQDLRPAALDRLGLLPALEWLASDVATYSVIKTKLNVSGTERRFPDEIELVLFRIVQEALRNVWRHSQATKAELIVEFDEGKTKIAVSDNGKGFKLPQAISDLAKDGKLGLAGMQERARLIGGTLTVQSDIGKGSTITIEIPE